jgi:hypothetical protein
MDDKGSSTLMRVGSTITSGLASPVGDGMINGTGKRFNELRNSMPQRSSTLQNEYSKIDLSNVTDPYGSN